MAAVVNNTVHTKFAEVFGLAQNELRQERLKEEVAITVEGREVLVQLSIERGVVLDRRRVLGLNMGKLPVLVLLRQFELLAIETILIRAAVLVNLVSRSQGLVLMKKGGQRLSKGRVNTMFHAIASLIHLTSSSLESFTNDGQVGWRALKSGGKINGYDRKTNGDLCRISF